MKTRFFALATLALALAACNNDNENLNGAPVAARFTADIAPATRAGGTTWDNGDRIGITDIGNDTQYGNVPFILKNGKFEAEGKVIYIEDTKTHTFRAYYPYNAAGGILAATTDATAQQRQAYSYTEVAADFDQIWIEHADKLYESSGLKQEDMEYIYNLGQTIGYLDVQAQEEGLALLQADLGRHIRELEAEAKDRMRLSLVVGSVAGVLLIIILI